MPRAKKTVRLWGNWSEEELQRAFDKIKFANCSVNAVSKEHGIPKQIPRDFLIFSSIKTFKNFRGWCYCLQGGVITYLTPGVITYLTPGVITFTCF